MSPELFFTILAIIIVLPLCMVFRMGIYQCLVGVVSTVLYSVLLGYGFRKVLR